MSPIAGLSNSNALSTIGPIRNAPSRIEYSLWTCRWTYGGWLGTGLGTSRAKWDFLPNAHSDFIFAVIGEELGLLGALVVLIAFGVLVWAGVRIAIHSHDTFERLLAAGVIAWISVQAVINLGAVTGLLPITGVPLPLVSFGGSALVVTLAGIGVLASVARSNGGGVRRRRSGKAAR